MNQSSLTPLIPSPLVWLLFVLLMAAGATAWWAFYYWWKRDRYTRERFAFTGFFALLTFGTFFLGSLSFNTSIVGGLLFALLKPLGLTSLAAPPALTPMETVLVMVVFGGLIYAYLQVFKSWTGQKSLAQHEQEQDREAASVLRDIKLLLSRKPESREKRAAYREAAESDPDLLERPESVVWHERARQLWLLRNRGYRFDGEYDPAHKCWLGEEKNTGALAVLACYQEAPHGLSELGEYARRVAHKQGRTEIDLIVAVKNDGPRQEESVTGCRLIDTSEAELLADLVDFSNYDADIRYRVERARLTDSKLTLRDTYTPSLYRLENHDKAQGQTLEAFIQDWLLDEKTERQLALLGEYGQGKSTASLLLCYHLLKQRDEYPDVRIPILIELRGKNLRTLTPEELLATWALHYDINVQALLHLHLAGRLLLIFEGFDEIDLSGDTEARISHFRTLWRLNYRETKIIVTGRSNFFLDSRELRRALGNAEQTLTLYLAPFNLDQIAKSLREADESTRTEILDLAGRDQKFYEVVARPSLLYAVSLLWQDARLSERSHIDSALVIDLFIRQTLERQRSKHDERPFMVLNSAERHYFMTGIAAYMAAKRLPNQIDGRQLEEAVDQLVTAVPDVVSQDVTMVSRNEDSRPLRNEARLDWQTRRLEIMHKINTDVRSCGLLVTDPTKDGAFRFAHKSYMELLQAQTISRLFSTDETEQCSGRSIANTWKLNIGNLQDSDEAMGFLAELLQDALYDQYISEDPKVAKGLWDVLVIGKFASRRTVAGFFMAQWIAAAGGLAGRLVNRFGLKRRKELVLILHIGIVVPMAVASVGISAGAVLGTFAIVSVAGVFAIVAIAIAIAVTGTRAVAGTVAIVAGAIAIAVTGAQRLIESGMLWQDALLLVFSSALAGALLGIVVGLAMDFLKDQKTTIFKRLRLWYRACRDLGLASGAIEKTAGKGMAALLEDAQARREGEDAGGEGINGVRLD